ncbi:MAG: type II CRISPR RNA-guided endonuclease Cas9 [Bacteroidaceae bacterium]|nr:type II CRISPR RNA-guided endonuclease Cas9 [Bacteroidaceae bacterium]
MKKVLGLDLGVGSIGWCLIEKEDDNTPKRILRMGTRIVPIGSDEESSYTKGNAFSKNADRTAKRTARKCYDRYQLRRHALVDLLKQLGMEPTHKLIYEQTPLGLWQKRADAASKEITLEELGRVLLHINQKRGYKHSRLDNSKSKETAYVQEVNSRYDQLKDEGLTIGQHFAAKLKENEQTSADGKKYYNYRIKEQVYPRHAYEEEVKKILDVQQQYHADLLTDDVCKEIFNIIFYQRDLKSCKNLVSHCEFESYTITKNGKEITIGPKVAPKTSPLAQLSSILETVNNISIRNRRNDELYISPEQKKALADFLDNNEVMKLTDLYRILNIEKKDGWWAGKAIGKGLKGNTTKCEIRKALGNLTKEQVNSLTAFDLVFEEYVDVETGEVRKRVDNNHAEKQPLYRLWHLIYSIKNEEELKGALRNMGIEDEETLQKLSNLDFRNPGYANKSAKAIGRILPYLMEGMMYSQACEQAGFDHSRRINPERQLLKALPQIQKNELRQPVVEKILQQLVNIVNAILAKEGNIDEIRVELARELKQNREERNEAFKRNNQNEKLNKEYAERIKEYGLTPTRNRIMKMKMWEESEYTCMYCGQPVNVVEFLQGADVEREHIIPRGLLFDNSFTNQVCSCRKCNSQKGMRTAYDFIEDEKGQEGLESYIKHINYLFDKKKINRSKLNRLLVSHKAYISRKSLGKETEEDKQLWENFIDRQLRLSQYIAKKSVEMLQQICRNVYVTSGSVTDFVRHQWGYDELLHDLNFERYKKAGLTAMVKQLHSGKEVEVERIKNWTKRLDNRHHAVDALAIACTTQGMIQRLNTLNASRDDMLEELNSKKRVADPDRSMLEKWLYAQPHVSYALAKEELDKIIVSQRPNTRITVPGKRYATKNGKRILAQAGIVVPRGALHAEFVYGRIMKQEADGKTLTPQFVRKYKLGIGAQGFLFNGKEFYKEDLKKDAKTGLSTIVVTDKIKEVLDKVVDGGIRRRILDRLNRGFEEGTDYRANVGKALANLKNLDEDPIYSDDAKTRPIRTVRKYVNSSTMVAVRKDKNGRPLSFVEPDGNHHVAFYQDDNGIITESIVTRWQAVQRKLSDIPIIIDNPSQTWNEVMEKSSIPDDLLQSLPKDKSQFMLSLQIGEAFILGMEENDFQKAVEENDTKSLAEHLYFVQNLSSNNYRFRRHVESSFDTTDMNKEDKRFLNIKSIGAFFGYYPHKVKITVLGDIKL